MTNGAEKSTSATTTALDLSSLDSLLSPKGPTPASLSPSDSVAESDDNDVTLEDDSRFSTVPLSGHASLLSNFGQTTTRLERRTTISSVPSRAIATLQQIAHRRSASSVTAGEISANILARLGIQRAHEDSDPDGLRIAGGGQQKLHEEFLRLHNERQAEAAHDEEASIDWDFWGAVISDYQGYAASNAEKLAKAIERGVPSSLRGMVWQLMAASKDTELENNYLVLLKGTSQHEKAIARDLGRTFPHHQFFTDGQSIGQENLFNVLKAYSLYDPQVGYCQGLSFIVAVLLLNMPDEQAFCLLVRLMHTYDLRGHFLPEMPKLQLRLFQFDRLVEELLPVLHVHFLRQGIKSSMFCSQWFLTLFSYRLPLETVFRIYDNCLASGIEAIFAFSIVLLQKNEEVLLSLKFDEILTFLNTRIFEQYKIESSGQNEEGGESDSQAKYNVDEFVQDAVSLRITPFMLDAYAHEYADLTRAREAHAIEMDALRTSNRTLTAKVKELDANLAQLNTEHVEVLNQLVMARLRNEEMEEELVRYKLLYAEAVHQNEDAMSSNRLSKAQMERRGSRHT